ncbi:MAG TPA: S8 family serine peptidase [Candidatus Obscuribacterales bacterium]
MTHDANLPSSTPGSGVPESSTGIILQRGGEELLLEKVSDRFTVHPSSQAAVENLAEQIPAELHRSVPPAQSAEFIVDPARRDQVMQAVRSSSGVDFASHVYRVKDNPGTLIYLTNKITIQFAPQVDQATKAAIATELGLQEVKPVVGVPNTFVFQVTAQATANPVKIANQLTRRSEVLMAEPNIVVRTQPLYRPNDPLYPKQWYLNHNGGPDLAASSHIFAEKAWDITRGSRSIVVAVADDSFDLNHPDFQGQGKIVAPKDLRDQDLLPLPDDTEASHGTACAGVAVAEENGVGIVGVAPGCALMPIRTTGFLDDDTIEQIFDWAVANGAAVISCSWGPSAVYFPLSLRQSAALTRAAKDGRNGKGCVIAFAAGNANRPVNGAINEQGWPNNVLRGPTTWLTGFAIHPDVIAVSACTSLNKKAAYSNWGTTISVCAPSNNAPPGMWLQETGFVSTPPEVRVFLPGRSVFTADQLGAAGYDPGDFTGDFGGTSSACPTVAGVAALVLSANPDLTAQEVRQILQQTADKIVDPDPDPQFGFRKGTYEANGRSDWFGFGKVNAFRAVQAAQRQMAAPLSSSQQIQGRNDSAVAIPDYEFNGIKSAIQINDPNLVRDIQVTVNLEHSFLGDLEISLIAPRGQTVLLQGRTLGRRTQLQASYSLQNTPLLRKLLNQPAAGRWQLWIIDRALMDTGTLKSWQLTLGV